MLIIVFSDVKSDPRVLKQIELFKSEFEVVTCGYGERPFTDTEHIQIKRFPDLPKYISYALVDLKLFWLYYWLQPLTRHLKKIFKRTKWDLVIANDTLTVPFALSLKPKYGVLSDLHEYFPKYRDNDENWMKRISPYQIWICKKYVKKSKSVTTVGKIIADEYKREFGFSPNVITNATPYVEGLKPKSLSTTPIRIVHSGGASRGRNIHSMMEGVAAVLQKDKYIFDLYLIKDDDEYFLELQTIADKNKNIRIMQPVEYKDLIRVLNSYDLGVHILPPSTFNNKNALPNKLFDYVQARLGVITGPSPEMVGYVSEYNLGAITSDFTSTSFTELLNSIDISQVNQWKNNSMKYAKELSSDTQMEKLSSLVRNIVAE